ncbi:MAG: hypothetical protein OEM82_15320 [Acidobacteriota bacterium]|nr:hypothetical protein [Acidobacteriota bacterium]MDH3529854.1 hypothetical protein [Acidobacteriota bacterium]
MKVLLLFSLLFSLVSVSTAQKTPLKKAQEPVVTAESLAAEAFEAHGGEKLRGLETLSMTGSVDVTSSAANQAIPASFVQIFSGDKYRLEVDGGFVQFVQAFDGVNTVTSPSRGFTLPPINRIGLMLLQRLGKEGFVVSESAAGKGERFRMTSPEGYFTDFVLDKKTRRIKGYESSYVVGGRSISTVVEIDKYEDYEGIFIPTKFAQKIDVSGMTIYAVFKSKTISVNGEIANELFVLGQ